MGDWRLVDTVHRTAAFGVDATQSHGLAIPSGGSAHTKGAWTTLLASAPFDAAAIDLQLASGNQNLFLIDIGIGPAGAEQVLIPNLLYQVQTGVFVKGMGLRLPIAIPKDTRVAARCQSAGVSVTCRLVGRLHAASPYSPSPVGRVRAYGVNTGTTRGTQIDPGGTPNTKGAYTALAAVLAADIRGFFLAMGQALQANTAGANRIMDIAIGGVGSEQIVLPDVYAGSDPTWEECNGLLGPFWIPIQAGARVAARASATINSEAERKFDLALYTLE